MKNENPNLSRYQFATLQAIANGAEITVGAMHQGSLWALLHRGYITAGVRSFIRLKPAGYAALARYTEADPLLRQKAGDPTDRILSMIRRRR